MAQQPRRRNPLYRGDEPTLDPQTTVYGRHPVNEALHGQRRVKKIWCTARARRDAEEILDLAASSGTPLVMVETPELDDMLGHTDHQGIAAEVSPFPYCSVDELLKVDDPWIFALDQVTDPHNLGAIARVCDAVGVTGILIPERRSARVTGAVCKASAGAVEHVSIAVCGNLADTLEQIKGNTMWVYGASERGTTLHTQVDMRGGIVLVLGAEGAGIRDRVRSMCDDLISLPMHGTVSSLNVATVAAVLGYEGDRQRRAT